MKKKYILFWFLVIVFSCTKENPIVKKSINGHQITELKIKNIKDSISLNLSDFFEETRFVKVETNDSVFIDNKGRWIVSDNYLIFISYGNYGVLQFDSNGKFIRQLLKNGFGPNEVLAPKIVFSEDEEQIYVSEQSKRFLFNIDLETGKFLNPIPLAHFGSIKAFSFIDRETLLMLPKYKASDKNEYLLYTQNKTGKLINGIIKPSLINEVSGGEIIRDKVKTFIKPSMSDTIYFLSDDKLLPIYSFDIGENPDDYWKVKKGLWSYWLNFMNTNYMILEVYIITGIEIKNGNTNGVGKMLYILYDTKQEKVQFLSGFKDDLLQNSIDSYNQNFNSNGLKFSVLNAITAIELRNKVINGDTKIKNEKAFLEVTKNLNENDNPILLIGKMKNEVIY